MTRGTLYIVEKLRKRVRVTSSCEFNGDMYEEERGGHGGEVMRLLNKTTNQKEFKENVKGFDKENFDYQSEEGSDYFTFYETYPMEWKDPWLEKQGNLVMVSFKDYFPNFFSDWTFWKNCTKDCEVQFFTRKINSSMKESSDRIIKLKPGQCVAINFGHYEDHYYEAPILLKGGKK